MQLEIAALADCANVTADGKLNIMGVFDEISAPKFPALHPFMVLVVRLRLDFEDGGRSHELSVAMEDEDGRQVFKADSHVPTQAIAAGASAHVNQVLNFASIGFREPGHYIFQLRWNGSDLGRVRLTIKAIPAGPDQSK